MEIVKKVERIIGKVVGHEISKDELSIVSGGTAINCPKGTEPTVSSGDWGHTSCDKTRID